MIRFIVRIDFTPPVAEGATITTYKTFTDIQKLEKYLREIESYKFKAIIGGELE